MSGLYISYRQSDVPETAMAIAAHLASVFGPSRTFIDTQQQTHWSADHDAFHSTVATHLVTASAMVVMIGPGWLAPDDSGRSKLFHEDDYVRIELETALERQIDILPVFVGGVTAPPQPNDLPKSVRRAIQGDGLRVQTDKFAMGARAIAAHVAPVLAANLGGPSPEDLLNPALGFTPITLKDGTTLGAFEALRLQTRFEQVKQALCNSEPAVQCGAKDRAYRDALVSVIDNQRFQMAPNIAPPLERAARQACRLKPYQDIIAAVDLSLMRRGGSGLVLTNAGLFHYADRGQARFFANGALSRAPITPKGKHALAVGTHALAVPKRIDFDRMQRFVEAAARVSRNASLQGAI